MKNHARIKMGNLKFFASENSKLPKTLKCKWKFPEIPILIPKVGRLEKIQDSPGW